MVTSTAAKFIIGLGNPGGAYARTRHNVGFQVVDAFCAACGFPEERTKRLVRYTEGRLDNHRVYVVKPQSYMNLSGPAVREFLSGAPLECRPWTPEGRGEAREAASATMADLVLVVHDDLDLPLGRLRYRERGSSGGHRGVESLIQALATDGFSRLRIGIGRDSGVDAANYVLEALGPAEKRQMEEIASKAAETLPVWVREGGSTCANRFNGTKGKLAQDA